jgi:outer membrane protein
MKKIFLITISTMITANCIAQQLMTLDNAIAIGLKNNYNIMMAKNQEAVNANDYSYAFGAFLPQISATAERNWSNNSINASYQGGKEVNVKGAKSNVINLTGNLNWTLFDGLEVFAAAQQLKSIRELGEINVKNEVVNTIASIIASYYDVVQEQEELESISDEMTISQERVNIAQNEFNSGLGSKIDLLQAEVDLNAQKAAFLQQQTLISESKDTLSQLIVLPPNIDFTVTDSIPVDTSLRLGDFQDKVFTNNFNLLAAKKNIDISQYALKETKAQYFPTISFNTTYSFNKQNSQPTSPYQALSNQALGLTYGFEASIPVLNGLNVRREVNDARLNVAYQQLNYENQKSLVSVALETAFKEYTYYKRAMQLEEQNLGVAKENMEVAIEAFKQGQTTTVEVETAQQGLANAESRLIAARYNTKLAETTLLQLRGDLLK